MIKKLNESHIVKKSAVVALGPNKVQINSNIRGIFNINKQEFNSVFIKHIRTLLSKKKDVVIVVSKPQLVTLAKILKEKNLFSLIDTKQLKIVAHGLDSKTGFYFQKDFNALLSPIAKPINKKNLQIVFFDADQLLHCELADAESRQIRDFMIIAKRTDLKIDLLSSQIHYIGINI